MFKKISMRYARLKRCLCWMIGAFALVFAFRLAYEIYFSGNDILVHYGYAANNLYIEPESVRRSMQNVATDKIVQKDISGQNITIDQKYEKTADMTSVTSDFVSDNQKLRQAIDDCESVIQMENLSGLPGDQLLTITIGVMPQRFDELVEIIREVGTLKNFTVNKVDKTDEFNYLLAEIETLKMTRDSYSIIKEKGGNIQDLLMLEEKILEVEKRMQELGVNLGAYSSENSFCTVNFTMQESMSQRLSVRFVFNCMKNSFFWTIAAYAIAVFVVFAMMLAVVMMLALNGYIKKMLRADDTRSIGASAEQTSESEAADNPPSYDSQTDAP